MNNNNKKPLLPGIGGPIVLPESSVPSRSPDLRSAYKVLNDDALCERLDQIRAHMQRSGDVFVQRMDTAICVLALDFGYDAEEVREVLEERK